MNVIERCFTFLWGILKKTSIETKSETKSGLYVWDDKI